MKLQEQQKIISILYIFLIISTILSFIPYGTAMILSLALMLVTLITAYFYKSKHDDDSLLHNHSIYMIGTIWIGGGFLFIAMLAAALIVYMKGDHSIVYSTMDQITSGQMFNEDSFKLLMMEYMTVNKNLLILASIPTLVPAILYFVYRVANGYGRAMKGYRIAKPKSWM